MTKGECQPDHIGGQSEEVLDLIVAARVSVQEFYDAYRLSPDEKARFGRQVAPYSRTLADGFFGLMGPYDENDQPWATFLNSSAYSATRMAAEIQGYQVDPRDGDANGLRRKATEALHAIIDFADEHAARLNRISEAREKADRERKFE